ncbi:MAG TPA: hypothetical protein VNZ05_08365 [Solirubrobacteraceae bacterium]|nr:hypothetical protein [Solirubrobacteraceae bacterium]
MHRTLAIILSLAALVAVAAAGATGCSSKSPSSGCGSATVSFKNDVMPVFAMNCTLSSSCHGQTGNSTEEDLYLGLNGEDGGPADDQAVYKGLVGVISKEDPSMNLVTAGSTDNSFLWHKVNNDQMTLASQCAKAPMMCMDCNSTTPCGGLMPYLQEALSTTAPDHLCTIQSWIQQGALNN